MVPEVGGAAVAEVRGSIEAMGDFTRRIIDSGAETVVVISPHAPLAPRAFVAYPGPKLYGDFARFRAPATSISFELDQSLLTAIATAATGHGFEVETIGNLDLDHGTSVPLYFLHRNGWNGRVVALGYSYLSNADHLDFGGCIQKAADTLGKRVALVASGDLSHRLKPEAPAGYHPQAELFDQQVVAWLSKNLPERIVEIDQDLRRSAGECGYRSMLVAIGAIRGLSASCDVLHYEAPFGVGYLVAQLTNARASGDNSESEVTETLEGKSLNLADVDSHDPNTHRYSLPELARVAVETFVLTGNLITPPFHVSGIFAERAACFVTIRKKSEPNRPAELRGCIGTVEPIKATLAEELIANAINSASRDPRYGPVSAHELPLLSYSVDVLSDPEPTTFEELDPKIYGVIVEDLARSTRGLLLPDIDGVDTAAKQVEIAARKAGIRPSTPLRYFRFRVDRYGEVK